MRALIVVVGILGALVTGQATASAGPVTPVAAPGYDTWVADVTPVANQAMTYLEQRLPSPAKTAVVFDIDNTTLETQYHFDLLRIPALQPSLAVAKSAKARGAAIFFVTGRPAFLEPVTKPNLQAVGYPVDGLYQTTILDAFDLQRYKTAARAAIEAAGFTIVANIGNSASDLAGGHAERTFKLPDYDGALN